MLLQGAWASLAVYQTQLDCSSCQKASLSGRLSELWGSVRTGSNSFVCHTIRCRLHGPGHGHLSICIKQSASLQQKLLVIAYPSVWKMQALAKHDLEVKSMLKSPFGLALHPLGKEMTGERPVFTHEMQGSLMT